VLDLFEAGINGTADRLEVKMKPGASVCVIAASGGYPGKYASGKLISGLDAAGSAPDAFVFHSGTAVKDGALMTAGGRVLGVTAMSPLGLQDALAKAYTMVGNISFEGMQFRRDIGWRALAKETV
jgi:phosphoribosylamine--glycine ligase